MALKIKSILAKVIKTDHREDEMRAIVDQATAVEHKIKAIMASVFKIDMSEINDETSSDNLPQWTSLAHVDFVLTLQKEFGLAFTDSQIVEELLSFRTIVQTVTAALNDQNN